MTPADACTPFGFAVGASLEHAVMHGNEEEAERIREELRKLTDEVWRQMVFEECGSVVQFHHER